MNDIGRDEAIGCPDVETLAAWSDQGLGDEERSIVEAHIADCARCQMQLAAMARMAPVDAAAPRQRLRFWPWLLPAAGAAAAAGLWFLVQPPSVQPPPARAPSLAARPAEPPGKQDKQTATLDRLEAPAARLRQAPEDVDRKRENAAKDIAQPDKLTMPERRGRVSSDASAAAAPAPPPAPEAAPAPAALEERIAVTPRSVEAFEVGAAAVQRSPDGRVTWEAKPTGITSQLTAGTSPSPSVIWLVGKGGLVLLSTDGRTWRRVSFPERVDLIGIQASSEATATVTTADGRTFTTSDGGSTWTR